MKPFPAFRTRKRLPHLLYIPVALSGQLSDLTTVELLGAEKTFRLDRRLVNFRPSKVDDAPLCGARPLDWQVCDSGLEAHRGYLRMDDYFVRVLTLKELPSETRPLLLNGLLDVPANFHVVTEWHPSTTQSRGRRSPRAAGTTTTPRRASSRISRTARTPVRMMSWSMTQSKLR